MVAGALLVLSSPPTDYTSYISPYAPSLSKDELPILPVGAVKSWRTPPKKLFGERPGTAAHRPLSNAKTAVEARAKWQQHSADTCTRLHVSNTRNRSDRSIAKGLLSGYASQPSSLSSCASSTDFGLMPAPRARAASADPMKRSSSAGCLPDTPGGGAGLFLQGQGQGQGQQPQRCKTAPYGGPRAKLRRKRDEKATPTNSVIRLAHEFEVYHDRDPAAYELYRSGQGDHAKVVPVRMVRHVWRDCTFGKGSPDQLPAGYIRNTRGGFFTS